MQKSVNYYRLYTTNVSSVRLLQYTIQMLLLLLVHLWHTPTECYRPECLRPTMIGFVGSFMLWWALYWSLRRVSSWWEWFPHPRCMRAHQMFWGVWELFETYGRFWSYMLGSTLHHHHQNTKWGHCISFGRMVFTLPVEFHRLGWSLTSSVEAVYGCLWWNNNLTEASYTLKCCRKDQTGCISIRRDFVADMQRFIVRMHDMTCTVFGD